MRTRAPWSKRNVKELLSACGVRPSKALGQTFLVSRRYAELIVSALDLVPGETVYEIGAGLGALTLVAAEAGAEVVAAEIDRRLCNVLARLAEAYSGIHVLATDSLKLGIPRGVSKVLSNAPYSISTQLVLMLARSRAFKVAVITLQREFADRLLARPGTKEYGRLTVIANLALSLEKVLEIPRTAFYPTPSVDSVTLRIKPKHETSLHTLTLVEDFTRLIFPYKRKMLRKALRYAGIDYSPYESSIGRRLSMRVYELSPKDCVELAELLLGAGPSRQCRQ